MASYWARSASLASPNCDTLMIRGRIGANFGAFSPNGRSEEHTSELQSQSNIVCRLLLEKKNNDGGKTWKAVGNKFVYDGITGTHLRYDGTPRPWQFTPNWHLQPSLTDPHQAYA